MHLVHAIAQHCGDNLKRAVKEGDSSEAGIVVHADGENVGVGEFAAIASAKVAEGQVATVLHRTVRGPVCIGAILGEHLRSRCLFNLHILSLKFHLFLYYD